MTAARALLISRWRRLPLAWLPFADAAREISGPQLARLALAQVSAGLALTLMNGTLNRIIIVEIGLPAWQVATFIALPLLLAPARALVGVKSDSHVSAFGWRRVPYIWMGTMTLFGGLALAPMSLMLMTGTGAAPAVAGHVATLFSFLLIGLGVHITQTAALALACDKAGEHARPRVVGLMFVVMLLSMAGSALLIGWALADFTPRALFSVLGYAALAVVALNITAIWKQEARRAPEESALDPPVAEPLAAAWRSFAARGRATRLLLAVGLATAAFNMQDVLLEPYGGEILGLSVAATTALTAIWAAGQLGGFGLAARWLGQGRDPHLVAAYGVLIGLPAFSAVIFSGALGLPLLFRAGTLLIGVGGGLSGVALLSAATGLAKEGGFGFAVGAWGTVQALSAGLAVAFGGWLRDAFAGMATAMHRPDAAYAVVYHSEIALLFAALVVLGPLVTRRRTAGRLELQAFPA